MGYFFGADNSRWGQKAENAQGQEVQLYAKQLSGTDIAMFARSSNLFGKFFALLESGLCRNSWRIKAK